MHTLRACSVGYRVRDIVEDRTAGQLYSVHANAVYCSIPSRPLLLIHCADLGGIPFGIGVELETGYVREMGLERDMGFRISDGTLAIPAADVNIDLCGATLWRPATGGIGRFSAAAAQASLDHALQLIGKVGSDQGLRELAAIADDLLLGRAQMREDMNRLCRTCSGPLAQLLSGIRRQDLPLVEDALRGLIGLGIGLTPSMDDVITGLISALHRFSDRLPGGMPWVSAVGEKIRSLSEERTTLISRNNLHFASSGDRFEAIDGLIDAILFSTGEDLAGKIGRLVSFGATTGTELTVGVLLGMKLVIHQ